MSQEFLTGLRTGYGLPQDFYLNPDIYARDLALLQNHWSFVGHVSQLPRQGDWITAVIAGESVIITRDKQDRLHAMANVCRHRGSRICLEHSGNAPLLVCPYHAWAYDLDGRLRRAREMGEDLTEGDGTSLRKLHLEQIGGLLFVSLGDHPPDLSVAAPALADMCRLYGWEGAKVAHRAQFSMASNWKLALENYHECYHCGPAHPEFSLLHALARPGQRTLHIEQADPSGHRDTEDWANEANGRELVRVMRSRLSEGCVTGSADGKLLAPAMGPADGHCLFAELGFLSAFLAYADYGVIYRFDPRGLQETAMEVLWLVKGDAEAGRDYDLEKLTWLWMVTSVADKKIIENNQAGVASRFFQPGPFSPMEPGARAFVERYFAEITGR